jgi:hypothetical protein
LPEPNFSKTTATFSPDLRYRFTLTRSWNNFQDVEKRVVFIMLNPSTADERVLDPTIRRCLGYAMDWGFNTLEIGNIFALRSTDPQMLYEVEDPIGPGNDDALVHMCLDADLVIAGWGHHGVYRARWEEVTEMIADFREIYCLGRTKKDHQPKHPLYLKKNEQPQLYVLKSLIGR